MYRGCPACESAIVSGYKAERRGRIVPFLATYSYILVDETQLSKDNKK
jgi:hypothetical protein